VVTSADNSNARPVWLVTGGADWRARTQFWQCGDDHDHRDVIRGMQPGDRIAMKADGFRSYATDELGNPADSVGIWAAGSIARTRFNFVYVNDDWRDSLRESTDAGRPLGNYRVDAIATRFPEDECIWRMEPDDGATRAFITNVFGPGAVDRNHPGQSSSSFGELANELYLPASFLEEIHALLEDKKQVIFQGPPGTGKTYVAQKLAEHLAGSEDRVTLVQFHPSYAYEDFVQGYRPTLENGNAGFKLRPGPLVKAAEQAQAESGAKHFIIIDEINRGNLAKVFGELYFLLEYRDREINLQYTDEPFALPENLYIIGTMNTADRSIALVDLALRRRFYFVEFHPDRWPMEGLLHRYLEKNPPAVDWDVAGLVDRANALLSDEPHAAIGPSHFMKPGLDEATVERIWKYGVLPYIEERLFGQGDDRLADFDLSKLRNASVADDGDNEDGATDE